LLVGSPEDYGWARATWTQDLVARQLGHVTRVRVSDTGRGGRSPTWGALGHGPPHGGPLESRRQARRVRAIEPCLSRLPAGEEAFNPQIGRDWMLPDDQKRMRAPGQNQKHYVAGELYTRTGQVSWIDNGQRQ
jgi:hypothetical protein